MMKCTKCKNMVKYATLGDGHIRYCLCTTIEVNPNIDMPSHWKVIDC